MWEWVWEYFDDKKRDLYWKKLGTNQSQKVDFPYFLALEQGGTEP